MNRKCCTSEKETVSPEGTAGNDTRSEIPADALFPARLVIPHVAKRSRGRRRGNSMFAAAPALTRLSSKCRPCKYVGCIRQGVAQELGNGSEELALGSDQERCKNQICGAGTGERDTSLLFPLRVPAVWLMPQRRERSPLDVRNVPLLRYMHRAETLHPLPCTINRATGGAAPSMKVNYLRVAEQDIFL